MKQRRMGHRNPERVEGMLLNVTRRLGSEGYARFGRGVVGIEGAPGVDGFRAGYTSLRSALEAANLAQVPLDWPTWLRSAVEQYDPRESAVMLIACCADCGGSNGLLVHLETGAAIDLGHADEEVA